MFKINHLFILFVILVTAFVQPVKQLEAGTIPTAPEKLLIIGDSLTSGSFASDEQHTFASVLAEMGQWKLARNHASNLQVATKVWTEVKVWNPDIIVVEIGLNDVSRGTMTPEQYYADYYKLLLDMSNTGANVLPCTMFWGGIRPEHPNYQRYIDFNSAIRHAADDAGLEIVDLWGETINCEECISDPAIVSYFAPYYRGDGFHPGDYGHLRIAKSILDEIYEEEVYFPLITSYDER